MSALKLTGARLLIELDVTPEATNTGIILMEESQVKPQTGVVHTVGRGRVLNDGTIVHSELKVGDRVIFAKYAGTDLRYGDKNLIVVNEADVLAVIE